MGEIVQALRASSSRVKRRYEAALACMLASYMYSPIGRRAGGAENRQIFFFFWDPIPYHTGGGVRRGVLSRGVFIFQSSPPFSSLFSVSRSVESQYQEVEPDSTHHTEPTPEII